MVRYHDAILVENYWLYVLPFYRSFSFRGFCPRWLLLKMVRQKSSHALFKVFCWFMDSWLVKKLSRSKPANKKTHQIHSPLKISVKNIRTSAVVSELHPTSPNPPHFNHLGRPEAATRLQTQSLRFGCRVAPVTGWMPCVHGGFWYVLVGYLPWKKNTHFRTWTTRVLRRWVGPFWGC